MNLRMQVYKTGTKIAYLPNLEKTSFLNFTFPRKWNEAMSRVE